MLLPRFRFSGEFTEFEDAIRAFGVRTTFDAGDYLCPPGEALDRCYYLLGGTARMSVLTDNDKDLVIGLWSAGSLFPLVATEQEFTLEPFVTLKALTAVETLVLTADDIRSLCRTNPDFAIATIDHYCRYTNLMLVRDILLTVNSSLEKVCNFLYLYWYNDPDRSDILPLTQDEIAGITGLTRVQVTRVITELRDEGVVATARGKVSLLDVNALKSHCLSLVRL